MHHKTYSSALAGHTHVRSALRFVLTLCTKSPSATHMVCEKGLRLFVIQQPSYASISSSNASLKISVHTDLSAEDKVPHWTSYKETTNEEVLVAVHNTARNLLSCFPTFTMYYFLNLGWIVLCLCVSAWNWFGHGHH